MGESAGRDDYPFFLGAGSAVGFKLDSLLKLTDTRATNNKMTLMHYLCKVRGFVIISRILICMSRPKGLISLAFPFLLFKFVQ